MAPTPSGHGYWLAGADGGVFSFGDASFYGSAGGVHLGAPIVGMAPTPSGHGYWLAGADGGVFSFGDASFYGSAGGVHLGAPIVGMAPTPSGHGYWLAGADGGVFSFGDGQYSGSLAPEAQGTSVSAIAAAPAGHGYWLATAPAPVASGTVQAASTGASLGTFLVTCYDLGGTTATGAATGAQTVAVDPSVIPLGSHIYVDGAGARLATDTGGAIIGRRLDIWEPTYAQCAAWGAQDRQVWIQG
jgi:3D (Asp-Asp-Asp) domain-containing protein